MDLTVIIPAMPHRAQNGMLTAAIDSIRHQHHDVEIIVAMENGADVPAGVRKVEGVTQVEKTNAGVAASDTELIAFLHDDDLWNPEFLDEAMKVIEAGADFVSSTSLEVDENAHTIGFIDCAVPSSWVMRRTVWDAVGPWDAKYHWHPDSEWLGRLGERNIKRAHLIDALAPEPLVHIGGEWVHNAMVNRALFKTFLASAMPHPRLVRHHHVRPLVTRRQHGDTIMHNVNRPERYLQSQWEYSRMVERFGRIPW